MDAKMAGKMAAEGGTDAWLTVRRFAPEGNEAKSCHVCMCLSFLGG